MMPGTAETPKIFAFGDFSLDLGRGALRQNGQDIQLRAQSFKVLRILVENHGQLVEKATLQREVWGNVAVTDDSLIHCLIDIRRATGDADKTMIRTVPRRGYLFDLPVTETTSATTMARRPGRLRVTLVLALAILLIAGLWLTQRDDPAQETYTAMLDTVAPANSLAVLPFADLTNEQDQKHFGEALAEEVLNQLAKSPGCTSSLVHHLFRFAIPMRTLKRSRDG